MHSAVAVFTALSCLAATTSNADTNFCKAITARQSITLSGGIIVDSYNSTDPGQSTNGQYDPAKRTDNAHVGIVANAGGTFTESGSADVYGNLYAGASSKVTLTGSASLGSVAWVSSNNKGIQPGWRITNSLPAVADATAPSISFATFTKTSGTVNGTNYTYVVGTGNYKSTSKLSLSGNMIITGNVVLYLPAGLAVSGQKYIYIAPGASLTVYLGASSSISGGGAVNGTGSATNCTLIGLATCTKIDLSGSSDYIGTIYAPSAALTQSGGGGKLVNFSGAVVAKTVTVSGSYRFHYDAALCSGDNGGNNPPPPCAGCAVTYPYASSNPLTSIPFNESDILRAFNTNLLSMQDTIRAWYNDEHALLLGIRQVIVKTSSGSVTNNYSVAALGSVPGSVTNPAVGTSALTGDQAGTDITNRPISPSLFVTDTTSDPLSHAGDWQFGGIPIPPGAVFGTWKAAVRTVDKTKSPPVVTVTTDADPAKNDWNLGKGDAAPTGLADEGFGAEVRWNVADLGLLPGHSYRLYFMLHDGDQNQVGGDVGQGCVNITVINAIGPTSRTNCTGDTVVFDTMAGNTGSYSFQWFKNGSLLVDQIGSTLTLPNITTNDAGIYKVIVQSQCGSVTNIATLTVNQPVIVTTPPQSITNCPGTTASFTITATGPDLGYQWFKNDVALDDTTSALTLTNVQAADMAAYTVVVYGDCGMPSTNTATLTVTAAPVLSCAGNKTVELGTPWTFDAPSGSASVSIVNTSTNTTGHCGNTFEATRTWIGLDDCGNQSAPCSQTVTVVDTTPIRITSAPMSQTNCANAGATLSVSATGTGLTYAWYFNGAVVGTGNTLVLPTISSTNSGDYSVVITDQCGDMLTNSATLTVASGVSTTPLVSIVRAVGSTATFSTTPSGTGPFTFEWLKDNVTIGGETNSSLVLNNLDVTNSGTYEVSVTGFCGSVSSSATLTVDTCFPAVDVMLVVDRSAPTAGQPYIDAQAAASNLFGSLHLAATADQGGMVSFSDSASLDSILTNNLTVLDVAVQNEAAAGGLSSISAGIQAAQSELASPRHNPLALPVIVLLSDGMPTSSDTASNAIYNAMLAKNAGTVIYSVGVGTISTDTLQSIASAPGDFLSGTNSGQLPALFDAVSIGICRSPTNIFTTGPTNQTVCPGLPVTFAVAAFGCDSFTYQWEKDGVQIPGASLATYMIPSATNSDAGVYSVEVMSTCQTVTNSAVLMVNEDVVITESPTNENLCTGDTGTFVVTATGTSLTYQWYFDSSTLTNQTNSVLTVGSVTTNDAGTYSVVVGDACGDIVTNMATLQVSPPPMISTATNKIVEIGTNWVFDTPTGNNPVTIVTSYTNIDNHCGNTFDATQIWAVTDSCGNSVTTTQTVSVVDTTAPVISCSTNKTVIYGTPWHFDPPTATDNSGIVTVTCIGTVTNTVGKCGNSFDATRTWQASDACGNSATCSQMVSVIDTTPIRITSAPMSQTNCPNAGATLSVSATGTGLTYAWYFKGAVVGTGNTLVLPMLSSTNSGVYSVVITDQCGDMATNCATVQAVPGMSVSVPSQRVNPGTTVTITATVTGGAGPFTYSWTKDNSAIGGATGSSITLQNVTTNDAGTYKATVAGACETACGSGTLVVSQAPIITIISPTNGAVFIQPATFTLAAIAQAFDANITNVEFYLFDTNLIYQTTDYNPAFTVLSNLTSGTYTYTAIAYDDFGMRATSAPVTITVLPSLPITITSDIHLDLQTGLYDQNIRVFNPTYDNVDDARVYITNLNEGTVVWNATGTNNGVAYVQSQQIIPSGGYLDMVIEYYIPSRAIPSPSLTGQLVAPPQGGGTVAVGTILQPDRVIHLGDGSNLVEFSTTLNRIYYVQYSADQVNWLTAQPPIVGNGTKIQWIDNGQPKTVSLPGDTSRSYRIVLLP
jgi:uncharacterized protein YegL